MGRLGIIRMPCLAAGLILGALPELWCSLLLITLIGSVRVFHFPFSASFCFLYLLVTEWVNLSRRLILFASLDGMDGVGRPLVLFCLLIYFGCTKSV